MELVQYLNDGYDEETKLKREKHNEKRRANRLRSKQKKKSTEVNLNEIVLPNSTSIFSSEPLAHSTTNNNSINTEDIAIGNKTGTVTEDIAPDVLTLNNDELLTLRNIPPQNQTASMITPPKVATANQETNDHDLMVRAPCFVTNELFPSGNKNTSVANIPCQTSVRGQTSTNNSKTDETFRSNIANALKRKLHSDLLLSDNSSDSESTEPLANQWMSSLQSRNLNVTANGPKCNTIIHGQSHTRIYMINGTEARLRRACIAAQIPYVSHAPNETPENRLQRMSAMQLKVRNHRERLRYNNLSETKKRRRSLQASARKLKEKATAGGSKQKGHRIEMTPLSDTSSESEDNDVDEMQQSGDPTSLPRPNRNGINIGEILAGRRIVPGNNIGEMDITCDHCGAHRWRGELSSICCQNGKINLPPVPDPPEPFRRLWDGQGEEEQSFRKRLRPLNNALAMASIITHFKEASELPGRAFVPTVILQGKVFTKIGALTPQVDRDPSFAQIYVHDPEYGEDANGLMLRNLRLPDSVGYNEKQLLGELLTRLKRALQDCNPYIRDIRCIMELPREDSEEAVFSINPNARPANEHARRFNLNLHEVAVLLPDDTCQNAPLLTLNLRQGQLQCIPDFHRSADPLHFVLLFPLGTDGWHNDIPQNNTGRNVTARQYYAYRIQHRNGSHNTILKAQRLFQEYLCVSFSKIENGRLLYLRGHQEELRAELYNHARDAIRDYDNNQQPQQNNQRQRNGAPVIGKPIILPASFLGSQRDMHSKFLDAMAIVGKFHKPDFFITFTCNPNWPEITAALLPNQVPSDRPDVIARVFNVKFGIFLRDLTYNGVLGTVIAYIYVIEWQKRGLPHGHLLLITHGRDRPRTAEDVDNVICAELPSDPMLLPEGPMREQSLRLQEIVINCMVHGPCGLGHGRAPCMQPDIINGGTACTKHYPMAIAAATTWDESKLHPTYRRRAPEAGGRQLNHNGREITNQWIVPYNPFLLLKYNAHINVEICTSSLACKYLFKYIHKGPDRAMVRLDRRNNRQGNGQPPAQQQQQQQQQPVDEIAEYQNMRHIGSIEGVHNILKFKRRGNYPRVQKLPIHPPDQHVIYFRENQARDVIENQQGPIRTQLEGFFAYNAEHPNTDTKYCNFPSSYTWQRGANKQWRERRHGFDMIGRINCVHPRAGDVFYLRMLLIDNHCKNKTSFQDLRTVNGHVCDTFKDACRLLGLLQNDNEWHVVLDEADHIHMPRQVRDLFATIILFCEPSDPTVLFENHWENWADDFRRSHPRAEANLLRAMCLESLEERCAKERKRLQDVGLPEIDPEMRIGLEAIRAEDMIRNIPSIIREEVSYDMNAMIEMVDTRVPQLTRSQRRVFDRILAAVNAKTPLLLFINARGGTGKTFLLNTALAAVRAIRNNDGDPSIALAVASSGLAANLMTGGRTAHSRFKIPLEVSDNMTCNVSAQSDLAKLLQRSKLIVWDEATMAHRHLFEAVDRCLRDLCRDSQDPFGGKVVVLSGDFRQILPIVKRGNRASIVSATIKSSPLWNRFETMELEENMRIQRDEDNRMFDDWLMRLGNGTLNGPTEGHALLDEALCSRIDSTTEASLAISMQQVTDWAYPNLLRNINRPDWISKRAILAPRNVEVAELNNFIIKQLPGQEYRCVSADRLDDDNQIPNFPLENLHKEMPSGMPPHELILKAGMPIILLRNLNAHYGLCNGTRLIVKNVTPNRLLRVTIAGGQFAGEERLLPRIKLQPVAGEFQISWSRRQFPVRPAFVMTINKAQGQTMERVGVWLQTPTFSHGQLYVSGSRVTSMHNIRFFIKNPAEDPYNLTRNVVYPEIL